MKKQKKRIKAWRKIKLPKNKNPSYFEIRGNYLRIYLQEIKWIKKGDWRSKT